MQNLWSISLQAVQKETNTFRQYDIYGGKDLFGNWVLTIAYGRIGKGATIKCYFYPSQEEMEKKLRQILQRRLASRKRIGINYQIVQDDFHIGNSLQPRK